MNWMKPILEGLALEVEMVFLRFVILIYIVLFIITLYLLYILAEFYLEYFIVSIIIVEVISNFTIWLYRQLHYLVITLKIDLNTILCCYNLWYNPISLFIGNRICLN